MGRYGMMEYGSIIKLMGMLVGMPFAFYVLYVALREKSRALFLHALGWSLFLMALAPGESYFLQKIFLALSGVCLAMGASTLMYKKDPEKIMYLGALPMLLLLNPFYEYIGGMLFSGHSFKIFMAVLHTAQYGFLLTFLGILLMSSSTERDLNMMGILYASIGGTLLIYPFAKAVSMTLRAADIFIAFLLGLYLMIHLSKILKRKIELVIPERTAKMEGLKRVSVVDKRKAEDILNKFKSFPVLAFVREPSWPDTWNTYIVTSALSEIENTISPTNLALINELCVQYLKGAKEKGGSGIVYLNCLEYLKLYNSFRSILKFLHTLRDYAILYNGTVIIEIDEEAWEERELTLLKEIEV